MPSIDACRHLYEKVNLTGPYNDTWCAPGPWLRAAELRAGGTFAQKPAAADMVGVPPDPAHEARGLRPRGGVPLRAFYGVHVASALQKERLVLPFVAAGECLVGRGHHSSLGPAIGGGRATGQLLRAYDLGSRTGLLGAVVETLPLSMAERFERHGQTTAASACIVGAACGRLLLQPARLLLSILVLAIAYPFAALTVLLTAMADLDFANPTMDFGDVKEMAIFFGLIVLCFVLSRILGPGDVNLQPRNMEDMLDLAREPGEGVWQGHRDGAATEAAHVQVKHFMRGEIEKFNQQQVETDADACTLADAIVRDLLQKCSDMPDDSAFRGGLNSLQSFMDLTFDDAQWRPSPDYEVLRFIKKACIPLNSRDVDDERALALANDIADALQKHFAGEPSPKPVQTGLGLLTALMQKNYLQCGWQAPVIG